MSNTRSRSRPRAFTLVELLVVIRSSAFSLRCCYLRCKQPSEAARRMQCGNNLKQLGVGFHNFECTNGGFPPPGGIRLWRLMGSITATRVGAHFCCRTSSSKLFMIAMTGNMTSTIRSTKPWSKRSCQYSFVRPRHAIPHYLLGQGYHWFSQS